MLMETHNYSRVVKDDDIYFDILLLETLNHWHIVKDYLYALYHNNERNPFGNYDWY